MTEIDPSVILKDGDCIYFRGVKYQKVEEPKPKTLYEALHEVFYGTNYIHKEEICDVVQRWLGDNIEVDTEEYNRGWNGCLEHLRYKIK